MSSIQITLRYAQHINLWILRTDIKKTNKEAFVMCHSQEI